MNQKVKSKAVLVRIDADARARIDLIALRHHLSRSTIVRLATQAGIDSVERALQARPASDESCLSDDQSEQV